MSMPYRPEIDGLRALAVVPVMLFHAGVPGFAGGFLGVDVFFVISGYLITSILLADLDAGRFSFARFYERRARRLLPALVPVLLASLGLALVWMLPSELERFSATLVATVLFASNVQLWRAGSDYFSASQEENPLLHTWSLSVEEQYYLLFPAALLVLHRLLRPRGRTLALAGLALASLALAELGSRVYPGGTFFLLPTRGWELLAGALCACAHARRGRRESGAGAAFGLALLAVSFALFDDAVRMPSLIGLLPVGGTCLVLLYAGRGTTVGRSLALRPFVYVGLISYGAYLWHQPILAFARVRSYGEAPVWGLCVGLVAALALAAASERWIERPFRARVVPPSVAGGEEGASAPARAPMRVPLRGLVAAVALPGLVFVAAGLAIGARDGLPGRFAPDVVSADRASRSGHAAECRADAAAAANPSADTEICTVGAPGAAPATLVLGDSHAGALVDALDEAMRARGEAVAIYSGGWCAPVPGLVADHPRKNPDACPELVELGLRRAKTDPAIERVVLVGEWANYTDGTRWGDPFPARYGLLGDGADGADASAGRPAFAPADVPLPVANAAAFRAGWRRALARLEAIGKPALVVESVPEFEALVARSVARARAWGGEGRRAADVVAGLRVDASDYAARNAAVLEAFESAPTPANVERLTMSTPFCGPDGCAYVGADGAPLYSDGSHLTLDGARIWVDLVLERLDVGTRPGGVGAG